MLLFHRVSPETNIMWQPLNPNDFESIIKFISKQYTFISLEKLFSEEIQNLRKSCVVVFDDGYEDFYTYALPVLKKYNVPTTVFIAAYNTIHREAIWTSQIDNCIGNTAEQKLQLKIHNKVFCWTLASVKEKVIAVNALKKLLISLPYAECMIALETVKEQLSYNKNLDSKLMNLAQINELKTNIDFQSHSYSHAYLPSMEDENILIRELVYSKNELEKYLFKKIHFLAYPIGGYNEQVKQEVRKHYVAAFAVDNKLITLKKLKDNNYKYQIPRFNIHYRSPYEVFLRINGFHKLFGR